MSAENVELVRRVYSAVSRRDNATVLALYHPDVEWDFSRSPIGDVTSRDVYRGHAGLRRWWREWGEAWEVIEDSCEDLIDAGDQVISVVTTRGRGRASGAEVEYHQAGVWTIREGKVVHVAWLPSREEALDAVGLRE
jgi:ketosteroid isomerase-like protein